MNKKIIWIGILVILLAVGYWSYKSFGDKEESGDRQGNNQVNSGTLEGVGTFASLFSKGSVKCEVSYQNQEASASGTVYVADKNKMRADFATQFNGQNYQSHMIQSDGYGYTWTEGMDQGFKFKLDAMTSNSGSNQKPSDRGYVDPDMNVNYDCDSWTVDNSKFQTPSNVTFTEFNLNNPAVNSGATGSGPGSDPTKTQACAACSQVDDAQAQAACRQALQCN